LAPLSLKLLRSFVAVADDLHFGRAARRLGLTQPPLSHHIQALEVEVGVKLFDRTRRRVALTAAGRLLHQEARGLLAHANRVRQVMDGASGGTTGELAIGCVPSALFGVLPPILRRFRDRHPGVGIALHEAHTVAILDQLADGTLDVGLAWENRPAAPLVAQPVWRQIFVAALPQTHPLAARERLTLAELGGEMLVVSPRRITPHHYDTLIAAFVAIGVTPQFGPEPATVLSQVGFVANGFGIGIVPSFAAMLPVAGVTYRPIVGGLSPVELCLIWHGEAAPRPVALLRESLIPCDSVSE
jgi:DNA-binding transcriptional LysR family regulator